MHTIEAMTSLLAYCERKVAFRNNKPLSRMRTENSQNSLTSYPQNTRNDLGRRTENEVNPQPTNRKGGRNDNKLIYRENWGNN